MRLAVRRGGRAVALLAAGLVVWPLVHREQAAAAPAARADRYHVERRIPPSLEPILSQLTPGNDAFPEEKDAEELSVRLNELAAALRENPVAGGRALDRLMAPEFEGAPLTPAEEATLTNGPGLEVHRATVFPKDVVRDRRVFADGFAMLTAGFETIQVAEFLITAIEVDRTATPRARTEVRYDLVGTMGVSRGERVGKWRMAWRRGDDGAWRLVEWAPIADARSAAPTPVFTEVTAAALGGNLAFRQQLMAGLDFWSAHLDGVFKTGGMGHHGVSVGDADGDGLDDLYVSQPAGLPNRLFRARGDGSFEDVTTKAGLAILDSTSQSVFADFDNDGDQDLLLVTSGGLLLFRNDGKGGFTRDPDAFRSAGALRGSPTSVAVADYDRDGFLDVYMCTYSYVIGASEDKAGTPTPYHDAQNGPPNVLLRNDGAGHFMDVTDEAGLNENNDRFSFAAAWADYDEDGWPDLLVANDFGRKNLYHNEGRQAGKVRFKDVAAEAGVLDFGAGMSAAWLDYDNDGHLDIYTGNMWTAPGQRITRLPGFMPDAPEETRELYRRHARGNSLFRNRGDGTFEDVTLAAGAEMGRWAWSSDALDFDNDGFEDLYVVNGMFTRAPGEPELDLDSFFWRQVTARSPLVFRAGTLFDDAWRVTSRLLMAEGAQARHERNVLLRNDGRGGFTEVAGTVGLDLDQDGRSFAILDYDGDGDVDLAVMAPRSTPQLRLFRNDFDAGGASLAVRLVGAGSINRDAIGARVTVETDRGRRTRIVQAGSGFISQRSKELLFGLGESQRIITLTVVWPDGTSESLTDVPLNHRIRIERGRGAMHVESFRPRSSPPSSVPAPFRADDAISTASAGTWLLRPFPAPAFTVTDLQGREHSVSELRGHPALLLFWATTAPASRAACVELARHQKALDGAGVPVIALVVDPPESEAKVRAAARGLDLPVAMAGGAVAATYSILHRFLFDRREELALPTLLLLDGEGEVVKVYRERIAAEQVLADARKIEAEAPQRLARAVPFEGTFVFPPGERNYFQFSLDLAEQGFEAAALEGFERAATLDPGPITFYNLGTVYVNAGRPREALAAFERAIELRPDYAEANNSLGALLAQSGDVPAAVARFRVALRARPEFPDALNNLGYALFQTGQEQEAHALFQKALEQQPDFPEAFNNLGIFFGQQGDLERAESYFRKAVEKRPAYGEAANNLALVMSARGDTEGALRLLERLLQDNPAFEMAYVTLCRLHVEAGQKREGLQVLERLLQRNPSHPIALQMLRQLRAGG
jgi:tetratricopeptide (TPR) repeat protein